MDKTRTLLLIPVRRAQDALKQVVETELPGREVYCAVKSATRAEWSSVARHGLKPSVCVTVWADEYEGELTAELDGQRYGVYRTYQPNPEELELYLEKKGGV